MGLDWRKTNQNHMVFNDNFIYRHFDNVQVDIKEIQTSSKKVTTRGHRMEEIQFGEDTACNLSNSDNTSPQLLPIPGGQNKAKLPGR